MKIQGKLVLMLGVLLTLFIVACRDQPSHSPTTPQGNLDDLAE